MAIFIKACNGNKRDQLTDAKQADRASFRSDYHYQNLDQVQR